MEVLRVCTQQRMEEMNKFTYRVETRFYNRMSTNSCIFGWYNFSIYDVCSFKRVGVAVNVEHTTPGTMYKLWHATI